MEYLHTFANPYMKLLNALIFFGICSCRKWTKVPRVLFATEYIIELKRAKIKTSSSSKNNNRRHLVYKQTNCHLYRKSEIIGMLLKISDQNSRTCKFLLLLDCSSIICNFVLERQNSSSYEHIKQNIHFDHGISNILQCENIRYFSK